jgi:glycosyltransferase involved in cell wall biosynthesis
MPTAALRSVTDSKSAEPRSSAKVVLSHPGTGPFVQQAARALHEAGLLSAYVTSFHYDRSSELGKLLRSTMGLFRRDAEQQLSRRSVTELPLALVHGHALPEIIRMLVVKSPLSRVTVDLVWERTERWFDRLVARRELGDADIVYAYEHAALATFQAQKARGGVCFYDMPICHHATTRRWVEREYEKFPQLLTSYERHRLAMAAKRNRRKDAELALADRVIAASKFVRDSLVAAGVPPEKIWQVPSGAPPVEISARQPEPGKFVFLMAGHLSVRKGTHYLLDAWRKLAARGNVELWLVGNWQLPEAMKQNLPGKVWISATVPRPKLYELFDRAHLLVFPTLAEGLATTPLQAMARGLPVITTPNSGCETFIHSGENGWLVPPCDADAVAAAMESALANPAQTEALGREAAATMARWQWSDYRAKLGRAVLDFLQPRQSAR